MSSMAPATASSAQAAMSTARLDSLRRSARGAESASAASKGDDEAEQQALDAARQFESVFVHQLFKAMRATVPEGGLSDAGFGGKVFTDMLDQKYAEQTSASGNFGLAEVIAGELLGRRVAPRPVRPAPAQMQAATGRYQAQSPVKPAADEAPSR